MDDCDDCNQIPKNVFWFSILAVVSLAQMFVQSISFDPVS